MQAAGRTLPNRDEAEQPKQQRQTETGITGGFDLEGISGNLGNIEGIEILEPGCQPLRRFNQPQPFGENETGKVTACGQCRRQ